MATTIAPASYPLNGEIILSVTINTMHEIVLPTSYAQLELVFSAAGNVLAQGGTDSTVVTTEKGFPVAADAHWYYSVKKSQAAHSIWVWSGTASATVSWWVNEEGS